jgi:hypothetical protein
MRKMFQTNPKKISLYSDITLLVRQLAVSALLLIAALLVTQGTAHSYLLPSAACLSIIYVAWEQYRSQRRKNLYYDTTKPKSTALGSNLNTGNNSGTVSICSSLCNAIIGKYRSNISRFNVIHRESDRPNLRNSPLRRDNLKGIDLGNINLSSNNLSSANLGDANLSNTYTGAHEQALSTAEIAARLNLDIVRESIRQVKLSFSLAHCTFQISIFMTAASGLTSLAGVFLMLAGHSGAGTITTAAGVTSSFIFVQRSKDARERLEQANQRLDNIRNELWDGELTTTFYPLIKDIDSTENGP